MRPCQFMRFAWHLTATLVAEAGREFRDGIQPHGHLTACTKRRPLLGMNKTGTVQTTGVFTARWCCPDAA